LYSGNSIELLSKRLNKIKTYSIYPACYN